MKTNRIVFLPWVLLILVSCQTEYSKEQVVEKSRQAILDQSFFDYTYETRDKFFDNADTIFQKGVVSLHRLESDTILGFHTHIDCDVIVDEKESRYELFYDGFQTVAVWHEYQNVMIDHPDSNNVGMSDAGFIIGNMAYGAVFPVFRLNNVLLFDEDTNSELADPMEVNGEPCHVLVFRDDDYDDYADFITTYYISKSTFLPIKRTFSARYVPENKIQFNELVVSYNETEATRQSKPDLTTPSYPESYTTKYYKRTDYVTPPVLEVGTVPKDFELPVLGGTEFVKLSDYRGKVVLIDFWYVACAPCKKALPHLAELHENYGDKGLVVLGINPFDAKRSAEELEKFYATYGVTHTNLLDSGRVVVKDFQISPYPTIYILDREGSVAFGQQGFHESKMDTIEYVVRELLEL
jgi:thiol-disulfide isomerase/thioredoxin